MVKLEEEQEWLNDLLEDYITGEDNEIYNRLVKIAKKKYSKGEGVAEFQEQFFQNFITNDKKLNDNLYNLNKHMKLIKLRNQIENESQVVSNN